MVKRNVIALYLLLAIMILGMSLSSADPSPCTDTTWTVYSRYRAIDASTARIVTGLFSPIRSMCYRYIPNTTIHIDNSFFSGCDLIGELDEDLSTTFRRDSQCNTYISVAISSSTNLQWSVVPFALTTTGKYPVSFLIDDWSDPGVDDDSITVSLLTINYWEPSTTYYVDAEITPGDIKDSAGNILSELCIEYDGTIPSIKSWLQNMGITATSGYDQDIGLAIECISSINTAYECLGEDSCTQQLLVYDSVTTVFPSSDFSVISTGTYTVTAKWNDTPLYADDVDQTKTLTLTFWSRTTTYESSPAIVPGDIMGGDGPMSGQEVCHEFTGAGDITDYLDGLSLTPGSDVDTRIVYSIDNQCEPVSTQSQVSDNCQAGWLGYSIITPGTYLVQAVWSDSGPPVYASDAPAIKGITIKLYTNTTSVSSPGHPGTAAPPWSPGMIYCGASTYSEKTITIASGSDKTLEEVLSFCGVSITAGTDCDTAWITPNMDACDTEPQPFLAQDSIALDLIDDGGLDLNTPGYYHLTWRWHDVGLHPYNSIDGSTTDGLWICVWANMCEINQSSSQGQSKMVSGEFNHTENLMTVSSRGGSVNLGYHHISYPDTTKSKYGPFGYGTRWSGFESLSEASSLSASFITVYYGDGGTLSYISTSTNLYLPPPTYTNKIIKNTDGSYTKQGKTGNITRYLSNGYFDYSVYDGNTTQYYYDSYSKITGIKDPSGRVASLNYDNYGRVTSLADGGGRKTYFSYSASSDLINMTNSMGYTKEFYYDSYHRMTTVRNYDGIKTKIFYGTNGKVTAHSLTAGNQSQNWQYSVNSNEKKVTVTDPMGRQSYKYYSLADYSSPTTISISGLTTIRYQNVLGQTTASQDVRGLTTYYQYDSDNNLIWQINPANQTTFYYYDSLSNQTSVRDILGNLSYYFYDTTLSQVTAVRDSLGNTAYSYYDGYGQVTATRNAKGTMHYTYYDEYGQVTATQGPSGCSSCDGSFSYYDSYGNKTASMDAMEHKNYTEYDALDRVTKTLNHYKGQTLFSYDSAGNLIMVTDAKGNSGWYYYDSFGRMTAQKNVLNQYSYSYYDGYGRITSQQDLKGQKSYYYYDSLSRVTGIYYPTDNQRVSRWYDVYDQLTAVNDPVKGMTYYYYDPYGQLTTVACVSSGWGTVRYGYDAFGRMTSLTNPAGNQFVYQYDNLNRLNWISNWANQTTRYYYDNYGSLTSVAYPNNTQTQYYFDTVGKLTTLLILRNGSSVLEQLNYEYDGDGNRTRMVDYAGNTTRFYYDGLHRLTWEYRLGSHAYDYQYSYDSVGNRMTKISNGTETTYYAYNELNQLTTSTVGSMISHYTYDSNGNMIYDDRGIILYPKHFTWNQKNQLIQFDYAGNSYLTLRYQYDVDGRKCYQISTTAGVPKYYRYLYDGTRVLQENEPHPLSGWNVGGRPVAIYTLAPGEVGNIISVRRSTTDYFYHYDGMGNVLFLTDTAGNKVAEYVMDSFGNIAYTQGASVNSYLWRTLPYDSSIESYQQAGRIYCSKITSVLNAEDNEKWDWVELNKPDTSCNHCLAKEQLDKINDRITLVKCIIDVIKTGVMSRQDFIGQVNKNCAIKLNGEEVARTYPSLITYHTIITEWTSQMGCSCLNNAAEKHERYHYQQIVKNGVKWYWWEVVNTNWAEYYKEVEQGAYEKEFESLNDWATLATKWGK